MKFRYFALALVAAFVLLGITSVLLETHRWRDIPFDATTWRAADDEVEQLGSRGTAGDVRRYLMLNDLCRQHLRVGMSRTEVHRLLGEPSCGDDSREYYNLFSFPGPNQKLIAWFRFKNTNPHLIIRFGTIHGKQCLVSAKIEAEPVSIGAKNAQQP